ncbi:hypothetical protein FK220_013375 [Flavobacteriaceae bacterium TP-CH-4]|uniref:Uncharacterized protein n=1 Tax=Pelagihabitans pacificus TaxID=2696054 RepID=A0A967AUP9_9FLAO|nr:hypothetical protein [Pelagihabitans pacificus]NHF60339.1 hypothetical protein [Pelagihabitans pacificus]
MRIIVYFLLSMLIGIIDAYTQETETKTKQTTTSSISISVDDDTGFVEKSRTYFSISDSDDTYRVRSDFHKSKTTKIRSYLAEELGTEYMTASGSRQKWKREYGGDTGYEVRLDEGTLKIYLDKELLSSGMVNKFKTITRNIKNYASGKSEEKRLEEQQKREAEQVQREAQQAQREAERLQRKAEQKIREAEHLQREAERLKREAQKKKDS